MAFDHEDIYECHPQSLIDHSHVSCPYGKPGDKLWVRKSWNVFWFSRDMDPCTAFKKIPKDDPCLDDHQRHICLIDFPVIGSGEAGPWHPPIHMPRWASRINLLIKSVHVERLHGISEEDAKAEEWPGPETKLEFPIASPFSWFQSIWWDINGKESWEQNPWVWVIEFERVKP